MAEDGAGLAIVLHTHMPYVEGFDTWPFGEEWLWEAVATSYLPVLELLERTGAPITVSLTPVLADQLAAPGAIDRCVAYLRDVRGECLRVDLAEDGGELRGALAHALAGYARAAESLDADPDVAGRLAALATWTSSATHAILPLLATDGGVRLQVETGIESARGRHCEPWSGGFWLPECAHAPWIDSLLAEAGVRATCLDLTDVLGLGSRKQLRPRRSPAGVTLLPIDRQTIELVWSDGGYPGDGAYRAYHRQTRMANRAWSVDGAVYDPARADGLAREHAEDFVARVAVRLRQAGSGALLVCAFDTELFGHWWHEGPAWLGHVIAECERREVALTRLDDALAAPGFATEELPVDFADLPVTSWGTPRDLTTWSGPRVERLAARARAAELAVVAAGASATPRAVRELLALQSSDWAFMIARDLAAAYGETRFYGHEAILRSELAQPGAHAAELRGLAPGLPAHALLA